MTMMKTPLTMPVLMDRGPALCPKSRSSRRCATGSTATLTPIWAGARASWPNALDRLGVRQGDRVATLAWNSYRHLEVYYAVAVHGRGAAHAQPAALSRRLEYIINHAEDSVICVDEDLLPHARQARRADSDGQTLHRHEQHRRVAKTTLAPAHDYEQLIAAETPEFTWPELDENSPMGLCYTSGTTGNPKGVMYTHRSNYLHTVTGGLPDMLGLTAPTRSWPSSRCSTPTPGACPTSAACSGSSRSSPARPWTAPRSANCLQDEKVTFTGGVPTIWLGVMNELQAQPGQVRPVERCRRWSAAGRRRRAR